MWDQRQFIDRLMQLQEESQLSSQKLSYHLKLLKDCGAI